MKKIVLSVLGAFALTATMSASAANACGYRSVEPCYVEPTVIYVKPKPKPRCCKRRRRPVVKIVKKVIIKKIYVKPRPRPRVRKCVVHVNVAARPRYCY